MWAKALWALSLLPGLVAAVASTDSIQDADPAQSGYLPNHNMDPNVVGSSSFGILWTFNSPNTKETWYAKPLTYTPAGATNQLVITSSNMNIVRVMDGKTGNIVAQRQLRPPFLQSDIGCYDIPNFIGITGTPIIDPATDIMYLFAKGYTNDASSGGVLGASYKFYALQLPGLQDVSGFPVTIDGHYADNDHARYFLGGTVLQRPSLTSLNGVVVGAFGGHCDLFNYTGMLVSVSKTPGVGVVSLYAMEAAPGAPTPQPLDYTVQKGGKAGIWQSGMGLATDLSRIFIVTGNGQGHANTNFPASGHALLSTLDEVVADFSVSSSGVFGLADYFEPYEYISMDAADRDLGSGGTCLLDGSTFKGTGVNRVAVVVGKNAKVYVLNADNLGGFMQGPGGTDNIIQTIVSSNSVFGGSGSYPLEGGYFYFTPIGDATYAYKFGTDQNGAPFFTQAGKTPVVSAGRTGVGQPTITTYQGQAGTAILWVTDVDNGLRAFNAVPDSNGTLVQIPIPPTGAIQKYQRPAFGDGRVYVVGNNIITCMGSPVNLPLQCSSPVQYGSLSTGATRTMTVNCTALIAINQVTGCSTTNAEFQCSNSSLPQGALAAGAQFSFPVVWNLTQASINDAQNVSFGKVLPGVVTTALKLYSNNGVAGYTSSSPISLSGTVVSANPFLYSTPSEVDFGGLVTSSTVTNINGSVIISNIGQSLLTFSGFAWQDTGATSPNPDVYTNVTVANGVATVGTAFTSSGFPTVGQQLNPGQSVTVPLEFATSKIGSYSSQLTFWSDGGSTNVLLSGSAANPPIANISVSTVEGGWDYSEPVAIHFGDVLAGTTVQQQIRICNQGGSVLTISRSKPPVDGQLTAVAPTTDLAEGSTVDVGQCAYGRVAVYANTQQPNHADQSLSSVWSLNTDGQDALKPGQPFGVHDVVVDVTITTRQVGPLLPNGTALYQWVGCFMDVPTRNLAQSVNNPTMAANNTNEQCQTTCMQKGYALAGTEYHTECWCGNSIGNPSSLTPDSANYCTYTCPGDTSEACGGFNGYIGIYADITKFNIPAFLANGSSTTTSSSASATASASASGSGSATGSASLASSSAASSTTSTSAAATPTSTVTTCPAYDGLTVTEANGDQFQIQCGIDHYGGDLSNKGTASFDACLALCSTTQGCVAVSFVGTTNGNCYMKSSVQPARNAANVWGAVLTGTAASSSSATPSSTAASSSSAAPSSTAVASSSSGSTSVAASSASGSGSSTSTTASATPTNTATICPDSNGTTVTEANGDQFLIECNTDHFGGDLTNALTQSFDECLALCASTATCMAVSWVGPAPATCYMKSAVNDAVNNTAVWGAVLVGTATPSSSTPAASSTPASSSTPAASSTPAVSSTPASSSTPAASSTPASSSTPAASSTPATTPSSTPAVSSSPSTTAAPSSTPSPSTTLVTSTSTTVSMSPLNSKEPNSVTVLQDQWTYIGCYKDLVTPGQRVLSGASFSYTGMTLESCAQNCSTGTYNGKPFNFFGTEYGKECYCGYTLNTTFKTAESDCSYACSGSSTELCGAGSRLSVYNNTQYNPPPAAPTHVSSAGGFNWVSCYTDSGARVLQGSSYTDTKNMTIENCAAFCNTKNWQLMGLEYHQECFCGNATNPAANGVPAPVTDCSMLCTGNQSEYCGGSYRLDFYAKPGALPSPTSTSSATSAAPTA